MLRRSCVGSKSLISPEQCSTISRYLYLLLRVLGASYRLKLESKSSAALSLIVLLCYHNSWALDI
ncbi:hypothetical protein HBI73_072510 [Parastagonospora nodorum]|nr:hypothetical protein HBI73_072510 [Parastagonospora nodorum]